MASRTDTVWAVDVGNNALKAIKLGLTDRGDVEVVGFAHIQHGKILTGVGVTEIERDELIAISLRRFVEQNEIDTDEVVISVSSQNSFARFVSLPPVEKKRIPELVRFEASQQIPFDINEVQWDWQLMEKTAGSNQNRVGIFAIKNEVVESLLEHFKAEQITVTAVQMAPMALYNYVVYDRDELAEAPDRAVVVLDIGAENTDLVVCTKSAVWQRCIPMGGNAFTKAIANAFKLSFRKAEKLKRTAPMSKYARQIFHAMRPVYSDLASEIQRSLNFYTNSNPNVKLTRAIALGGGTRMRGLLKYLHQTLRIPVERPETFKKLRIGPGVSATKFHDNAADFGVVYGLGLQGLGLGRITSNLLPRSIARSVAWAGKARYFTAAALLFLLVSIMSFGRTSFDKASYNKAADVRQKIGAVIARARQAQRKLRTFQEQGRQYEKAIEKEFEPFAYRAVVPLLYQTLVAQLPNEKNNPEQAELYRAFAAGQIDKVKQIPRKQRKQLFLTNISISYTDDVDSVTIERGTFRKAGARSKKKIREMEKQRKREEFERQRLMEELKAQGMTNVPFATGWGLPGVQAGPQGKPGFIVTIAGYSPYHNINELLDPRDVENDPNRWGFVTRLKRLDKVADVNLPFKLYSTDPSHFRLQKDAVVAGSEEMPAGIGVMDVLDIKKTKTFSRSGLIDQILRDPMTNEIISKVPVLENGEPKYDSMGNIVYETNDYWFALALKFVWEDAPKPAAAAPAFPGAAGRPR